VIAFLDANVLIYLLEGEEQFARRVRATLNEIIEAYPGIGTGLSRLSWLECRVGPMKSGDLALIKKYDDFFARPDLTWIDLTKTVVEIAAEIRARTGLKTPDCLQAACCLQIGKGHVFVTGDTAFKRVHGLTVRLLR
jgi:predicted nucleic acid-binding protein